MNWNRYPRSRPAENQFLFSRFDALDFSGQHSVLPYGNGRSYSDCCLNDKQTLISVNKLNRFIAFDHKNGVLTCEAGVTLAEILKICVPQKWFLPVLPGTQHVTIGGAIANDIHGKNHVHAGSFGCHVMSFELLRSDGQIYHCSADENSQLFAATIGGLGLTGVILSATIRLKPITNSYLDVHNAIFNNFDEFIAINDSQCQANEYTIAWMDPRLERGYYLSANHNSDANLVSKISSYKSIALPIIGHAFLFNRFHMNCFNQLCFYRAKQKTGCYQQHYQAFFIPLDKVKNWNLLYGRKGFLQYQCVLSDNEKYPALKKILQIIERSNKKPTLVVLKNFGKRTSPGWLSFPQSGLTIAIDFANPNQTLFQLLNQLDEVVLDYAGRVNPAKDTRMSSTAFKAFFPNWQGFTNYIDPQFSSNFWRRVMS